VASGTDANSLNRAIRKFYTMDRDIFVANIRKEKVALTWERFANDLGDFADHLKNLSHT